MKKIKIGLMLIVLLLVALLGYQNKEVFLHTHNFKIDLLFYSKILPELPNAALLAGFFSAGLLLTFVYALSGKFKSRKTIKALNSRISALQEENGRLAEDVRSLKAGPPAHPDSAGDDDRAD